MLEMFGLVFMQKAFIAGFLLALVLSFLGVFVTLKRVSFFGDGIAHASLAGIALGIITGFSPFVVALLIGVLFGAGVYLLEHRTKLPSDTIIGILFTTGMAVGVILLSLQAGYQPDLISFLFGNILAIQTSDLFIIGSVGGAIFIYFLLMYRRYALLIFDPDEAWLKGLPVQVLDFIFYVVLALAVVLGVKLLGIVLVSALLIIPAASAKLVTSSFRSLIVVSILLGELAVFTGLVTSYIFDLPSGAVVILISTAIFILLMLGSSLSKHKTL